MTSGLDRGRSGKPRLFLMLVAATVLGAFVVGCKDEAETTPPDSQPVKMDKPVKGDEAETK